MDSMIVKMLLCSGGHGMNRQKILFVRGCAKGREPLRSGPGFIYLPECRLMRPQGEGE